jgi:hypothetical protein
VAPQHTRTSTPDALENPNEAAIAIRQTIALKTLQYELADGCGARATDATDSLLVVNLKAAKAIGLAISETFLAIGQDLGSP